MKLQFYHINWGKFLTTLTILGTLIYASSLSTSIACQNEQHKKTLKVAVVSSNSEFCNIEKNIGHFESFINKAANQDARLICFPELALTSYTTNPVVLKYAEEIPGSSTGKLERLASFYNIYISMGMG